MTMYAKLSNGQVSKFPYTSVDLRKEFPQTSFPASMDAIDLSSFDVVAVQAADPPDADSFTTQISGTTAALVDGTWRQQWTVTQLSNEEASSNVRAQRNKLLAETDWTQLPDAGVASTWTSYRQALRDIPDQTGFPYTVSWPTKPS